MSRAGHLRHGIEHSNDFADGEVMTLIVNYLLR